MLEVGEVLEGKITGITKFGAFVELPGGKTGLVHISEVAQTYVQEISDHIKQGDMVKVKVLTIDQDSKIRLSIKRAMPPKAPVARVAQTVSKPDHVEWGGRKNAGNSFEDMMSKFKQRSEEKMSDIKRNTESKRGSSYSKKSSAGK